MIEFRRRLVGEIFNVNDLIAYHCSQINRQRKKCRAKYYENSVHHLKQCKPSAWWKEVKNLSGMNVVGGISDEMVKALRPGDDPSNLDKRDLANEINNAFLAPVSRYAHRYPQNLANIPSNPHKVIQ